MLPGLQHCLVPTFPPISELFLDQVMSISGEKTPFSARFTLTLSFSDALKPQASQ